MSDFPPDLDPFDPFPPEFPFDFAPFPDLEYKAAYPIPKFLSELSFNLVLVGEALASTSIIDETRRKMLTVLRRERDAIVVASIRC